ncbi:MAG: glycerate kinase [Flavobacteriaceae bacterium]|nr:glycerate kinase [Flavobacteriaceae bacterium]
MRILLIPDKFKGSLTARQVIDAIKKGISAYDPSIEFEACIASDGGDGFLDAIAETHPVDKINILSIDPLGRKIDTFYYTQDKTAYIELANSSGLALLTSEERNVLKTATYGTGMQIADALDKGIDEIYIGLGGSATNDGGMGIAVALGYRFLDQNKMELEPIGENLQFIDKIVPPDTGRFINTAFFAVNDVKNPLFGTNGAALVYGKQKGADQKALILLDKGLVNLHTKVKEQLKIDVSHLPGSGAAGGAAYGLKVFFQAEFISGIDFILQKNNIHHKLKDGQIDLIITGEGKIDKQTTQGKLIDGITGIGKKYGIPVLAVCGINELTFAEREKLGLRAVIGIHDDSKSLEYTMNNASELLQRIVNQYFKDNY